VIKNTISKRMNLNNDLSRLYSFYNTTRKDFLLEALGAVRGTFFELMLGLKNKTSKKEVLLFKC